MSCAKVHGNPYCSVARIQLRQSFLRCRGEREREMVIRKSAASSKLVAAVGLLRWLLLLQYLATTELAAALHTTPAASRLATPPHSSSPTTSAAEAAARSTIGEAVEQTLRWHRAQFDAAAAAEWRRRCVDTTMPLLQATQPATLPASDLHTTASSPSSPLPATTRSALLSTSPAASVVAAAAAGEGGGGAGAGMGGASAWRQALCVQPEKVQALTASCIPAKPFQA